MLKKGPHILYIPFHITTFYNSARRSQKRSDLFKWVPVSVEGNDAGPSSRGLKGLHRFVNA